MTLIQSNPHYGTFALSAAALLSLALPCHAENAEEVAIAAIEDFPVLLWCKHENCTLAPYFGVDTKVSCQCDNVMLTCMLPHSL